MSIHSLIVNMFAGPGAGKSTLAAMVFAEIKRLGAPISAELALEFAKDLVFEGRNSALANQAYVLGEQMQRVDRIMGKVDVVITDSPILMSGIYAPADYPASFTDFALWAFRRHPSINVFVERHDAPYETVGRIHTEEEARHVDQRIRGFLAKHQVSPLMIVKPTLEDARLVVNEILDRLVRGIAA